MYNKLAVIILAAGKGTRMKSPYPKVLHELDGKPLLAYPLELSRALNANRIIIVVGYQAEQVRLAFQNLNDNFIFVVQEPQLGTGHAVMTASKILLDWQGPILILCGDVPLLRPETVIRLLHVHRKAGNSLTVLSTEMREPNYYGRLIIEGNTLKRIVEYRDANESERNIILVNSGIYIVEADVLLQHLPFLTNNNIQKEYYLTDLIELMNISGLKVGYTSCQNSLEVIGINSQKELTALAFSKK